MGRFVVGVDGSPPSPTELVARPEEGRRSLQANAADLLGPERPERTTRIMATMPAEAADDVAFVRRLVACGMDCARIDCAHDGPDRWARMVAHLRRAAADDGRRCPVLMDLPGPELRTGPIAGGPRVVRLRPARDQRGLPVAPARAVLSGSSYPALRHDGAPSIPVPGGWVAALRAGDRIELRDTRGSPRSLEVSAVERGSAWVVLWDTTYIETGMELCAPLGVAVVGLLPPVEQSIHVRVGDVVTLRTGTVPAVPPTLHPADAGCSHVCIGCTLPEALRAVRVGQQVWFDDGETGGLVRDARGDEIDVEVTVAGARGRSGLKGGRRINLPDTDLDLPAWGPDDDATLELIAKSADLVGLPFAQRISDVTDLRRRLGELGRSDLGIVLEIETASGFRRLPELLAAGMGSERLGVMVARGDLAVECGLERLAEVQEEILWLCDAAHVPVVWATRVLDLMARTGRPSRAELSEAVTAARPECVMVGNGPHVGEAVGVLDDILRRTETRQHDEEPLVRRLRRWTAA